MTHPSDSPSSEPVTPKPSRIRIFLGIAIIAVFSALCWLLVFGQLLVLAPKAEQMFGEFKARTPWLAERVMRDGLWVVPVIMTIAFLVCLLMKKRAAWGFALLVLPLLINVVISLSLFVPTLALLDGLIHQLAQR